MATSIRFRNIYSLYDDFDAKIIEELLEGSNIACFVRSCESTTEDRIDKKDGYTKRIAVEVEKAENAIEIIETAIESGIISNDGVFDA